jgi:hypothetical protein
VEDAGDVGKGGAPVFDLDRAAACTGHLDVVSCVLQR